VKNRPSRNISGSQNRNNKTIDENAIIQEGVKVLFSKNKKKRESKSPFSGGAGANQTVHK